MLNYLDDATLAHARAPLSASKAAKVRAAAADQSSLAPLISDDSSSVQQDPALTSQQRGSEHEIVKVSVPVTSPDGLKVVYMPRGDYLTSFARDGQGRFVGTEAERTWTREELEERFGRFVGNGTGEGASEKWSGGKRRLRMGAFLTGRGPWIVYDGDRKK